MAHHLRFGLSMGDTNVHSQGHQRKFSELRDHCQAPTLTLGPGFSPDPTGTGVWVRSWVKGEVLEAERRDPENSRNGCEGSSFLVPNSKVSGPANHIHHKSTIPAPLSPKGFLKLKQNLYRGTQAKPWHWPKARQGSPVGT